MLAFGGVLALCAAVVSAQNPAPGQECASLFAQCGGRGYNGPECCVGDSVCTELSPAYSQCTLESFTNAGRNSDAPDPFTQCGGRNYDGPTDCAAGFRCVEVSDFYSQCVLANPGCVLENGQCGGTNYNGATECCDGNTCGRPPNATDSSYLQCLSGPNVEAAEAPPPDRDLPPVSMRGTGSMAPEMGPMMAMGPEMGPMMAMAPGPALAPGAPGAAGTASRSVAGADTPAAAPSSAARVAGLAGAAVAVAAAMML